MARMFWNLFWNLGLVELKMENMYVRRTLKCSLNEVASLKLAEYENSLILIGRVLEAGRTLTPR